MSLFICFILMVPETFFCDNDEITFYTSNGLISSSNKISQEIEFKNNFPWLDISFYISLTRWIVCKIDIFFLQHWNSWRMMMMKLVLAESRCLFPRTSEDCQLSQSVSLLYWILSTENKTGFYSFWVRTEHTWPWAANTRIIIIIIIKIVQNGKQ